MFYHHVMRIKIPKGIEVDMESGVYEGLATFTLNEDGTMTLTEVDGVSVSEAEEPEEKEEEEKEPQAEEKGDESIANFVSTRMKQKGMM